jgi:hypothetical protein
MAVAFGLVGLGYVAAALMGLLRGAATARFAGLLILFVVLRSAFLGTLENPEPRYTLECYPVVLLWAAFGLTTIARKETLFPARWEDVSTLSRQRL